MIDKMELLLSQHLTSWRESRGLVWIGVSDLNCDCDYERYEQWLQEGRAGNLHYLTQNAALRKNPGLLLTGACSALVYGLPYLPKPLPLERTTPQAALYAHFRDYHKILREAGRALSRLLESAFGPDLRVTSRVCVDTAPLLERALAGKTGSGFIGRNTCFIHPRYGSFLLLGELLTNIPASQLQPHVGGGEPVSHTGCGSCHRCQVICPTQALNRDFQIDARLCLAYWTIENRGPIPFEFWPHLKDYYFGCDLCQTVCPYNSKKTVPLLPRHIETRHFPELFAIATMDQRVYEHAFGGTPMTRAGRLGLRRNALIAMAVTAHPRLAQAMECAQSANVSPLTETVAMIAASSYAPQKHLP